MLKTALYLVFGAILAWHTKALASDSDLVRRDPGFGNLTSASWIWAPGLMLQPPFVLGGNAGLRKVYTSPPGRSAVVANCQVAVSSKMSFYVNGVLKSTSRGTLYIPLLPFSNLFAVVATTGAFTPALGGFIAACQIVFSDGTMDTLVTNTDGTWNAATLVGNDLDTFYRPEYYENSAWVPAGLIGPYNLSYFPPVSMQPMPPIVDFSSASWIWTNEGPTVPGEARAFRYTFTSSSSQQAMFATVVVTCDNSYTFWLNGALVALSPTPANWQVAQRYVVPLQSTGSNLFAFAAYNDDVGATAAGLLVSVQVQLLTGSIGVTDTFTTDSTWMTLNGQPPPVNFHLPSFNDASWNRSTVYAQYGGGPWGSLVSIPSLLPEC
ncbi:hypothetical protein B0H10DRAFT_2065509 [Mycena sp. CBHHK59/15]|nr:hypothetical protein B0H10DRAFT_2065509 [Mycena sp. CBHHK59/15]